MKWILMTERPPPDDWPCLVYGLDEEVGMYRMAVYRPLKPSQDGYADQRYEVCGGTDDPWPSIKPTHWMPLPETPDKAGGGR